MRNLVGAGYEPGVLLAPVLGVLCITTEYRQKVLTTTLLVTPRREQVLVAKVLASVVWSLFLGVAGLVLVAAMGVPLFVTQGGTLSTLLHQVGPVVPGLLGAYALLASSAWAWARCCATRWPAVIFTIALVLVLEPIIVLLVHNIFHADLNWLPSRSTAALAGGLTHSTATAAPPSARCSAGGWAASPSWLGGSARRRSATSPRSAATSPDHQRR